MAQEATILSNTCVTSAIGNEGRPMDKANTTTTYNMLQLESHDLVEPPPSLTHLMDGLDYDRQTSALYVQNLPSTTMLIRSTTNRRTYRILPRSPDHIVDDTAASGFRMAQCVDDGTWCLLLARSRLPPAPTPPFFLQPTYWAKPTLDTGCAAAPHTSRGDLVLVAMRFDHSSKSLLVVPTTDVVVPETPVTLGHLLRDDGHRPRISSTQIVHLVTHLAKAMDDLPLAATFHATINSVIVTNPNACGTDRPLTFILCPFYLTMNDAREMPLSNNGGTWRRELLMADSLATLCLHLAIHKADLLERPDLLPNRLIQAFYREPGLVSLFVELHTAAREQDDKSMPSPLVYEDLLDALCDDDHVIQTITMPSVVGSRLAKLLRDAAVVKVEPQNDPLLSTATVVTTTTNSPPPTIPVKHVRLRDMSRTLACLSSIKHGYQAVVDDMPALLQLLSCVDSLNMHAPAIEALWNLILGASKPNLALIINMLAPCCAILVPRGGALLTAPSDSVKSTPWILRMNIIDRLLFEIERTGDYGQLRKTQQTLMDAGIGRQLSTANICQSYSSTGDQPPVFSFKVLMPIIRVSILMAFQFSTVCERYIHKDNVRHMTRLMGEASTPPRNDIHPIDVSRFTAMALVMSDMGTWLFGNDRHHQTKTAIENNKHAAQDAHLRNKWHELDEEIFLMYVMPCWHKDLSDETTALIVAKLKAIHLKMCRLVVDRRNKEGNRDSMKEGQQEMIVLELHERRRMNYIAEWCIQLAWHAPSQTSAKSVYSPYASYFMAHLFRHTNQEMVMQVEARHDTPLYIDPTILDDSYTPGNNRTTNLLHQISSLPLSSSSATNSAVHHVIQTMDLISVNNTSLSSSPTTIRLIPPRVPLRALIAASLKDLHELDGNNPESLPWMRRINKVAITDRHLIGQVRHFGASGNCTDFAPYYKVRGEHGWGVPSSPFDVSLIIPTDRLNVDLWYKSDKASSVTIHHPPTEGCVRDFTTSSASPSKMSHDADYRSYIRTTQPSQCPSFRPITLVTERSFCHTNRHVDDTLLKQHLHMPPNFTSSTGTTGMWEVVVRDGGLLNQLTLGITWFTSSNVDSTSDATGWLSKTMADLLPGRAANSIGLDVHTGHVYYRGDGFAASGHQIKIPLMRPGGTNTRVAIGIAGRLVYFLVNGETFYPPLPLSMNRQEAGNFAMLPENVSVFGLARVYGTGTKLTTCAMAMVPPSSVDIPPPHIPNNVMRRLALATSRSHVCPHLFVNQHSRSARFILDGEEWRPGGRYFLQMPEDQQQVLSWIDMASPIEPCDGGNCGLVRVINDRMDALRDRCNTLIPGRPEDAITRMPLDL